MREISASRGGAMRPSAAQRNRAGRVKIAPAATDSPAEPMVCTTLLSSTEFRRRATRRMPIASTAAGMEADTVMPTRRPRYALAAPKTTASTMPVSTEVTVSSGHT